MTIEKQLKLYRHLKKYWLPYGLLYGLMSALIDNLVHSAWLFDDACWWWGNLALILIMAITFGGLGFYATSLHWIDQLNKQQQNKQ